MKSVKRVKDDTVKMNATEWMLFDERGAEEAAERLNEAATESVRCGDAGQAYEVLFGALENESSYGADDTVVRELAALILREAYGKKAVEAATPIEFI